MALSTLYGVCISIKTTQLKLNVNTQNLTITNLIEIVWNFYFYDIRKPTLIKETIFVQDRFWSSSFNNFLQSELEIVGKDYFKNFFKRFWLIFF